MRARLRILRISAIGLLLAFSACARTQQTPSVTASGFLKDYSMLTPGGPNEAQYRYINPKANLKAYDKILIEPVVIFPGPKSKLAQVPPEDQRELVTYLQSTVVSRLSEDYTFVGQPGPGVMRLRAAITEARKSRPVLDLVTTVVPFGLLASSAKRLVTGTHSFVGGAAIEMEILDSMSGERLMAAVDERAGSKALRGKLRTWDDVKDAYDYWAERFATRLAELRAR